MNAIRRPSTALNRFVGGHRPPLQLSVIRNRGIRVDPRNSGLDQFAPLRSQGIDSHDYFAYPGVREWWATRKHWLTDEFRAVVEPIIARNPEPKMYAAYGLDETPKG